MKTKFAPFLQKRLRMYSVFAALATAGLLHAQSPAARIATDVHEAELAVLPGSQHPAANPQFDAGRVPAGTRLNGITIAFSRSAGQQAALDALMKAQQDPTSPSYHQWLTPDQFAARFGMAQADIDAVTGWLERQGFTVDSLNRSRNAIHFSGSVGQVESAFQTQMHYYTVAGEKHFAPSTSLSIPAGFVGVVGAVRNLTDFRPHPQHVIAKGAFTSGTSGNVFFQPGDIVTAYDMKPLYSGGVDGTGQTIAIMGQTFVHVSDIEAFQSASSPVLPKKDPALILVPGTGNDQTVFSGDQSESDLDLEWSSAMAPGADVVFVYTGSNTNYGVFDATSFAVDNKIGNIISLSYSTCETELSAANLTSLESMFQQAAAQGQTVMAASGDTGSTACSGFTNLTAVQQQALAVSYPASSAYVTGVGGTSVTKNEINGGSNYSTYWTKNGTTDVVNSLIKYIPEVTWNDSSTSGLSSSGGGTSALVTRPTWQTGVPGIPSGTFRLVPDISFYSSPGLPGFIYCTSDSSAWFTGQTGSCGSGFRASSSDTSLTVAGGTSFATPIFAGMVALLNQKLNYTTGQGLINPTLYSLASNSAKYASAFHDVTSGNNNCTGGATLCGTNTGGFAAGTGYDEVTGLGSLDIANVAAVWPANTGSSATLINTSTVVSASNTAPASGANDTFTITVTSKTGSTIPTGNVTLQIDGGTNFGGTTVAAQALSATGTLTYTTSFTSAGPHQVLAQYAGDSTHAPSVGSVGVTVPGAAGSGTFKLAATDLTVKRGTSGSSTLTVTPSGGYTGTVNLDFTTSNNSTLQNLCYSFTTMNSSGIGTVAVTGTAAVTTLLTLDTKAADCVTAAATAVTGKRQLKTLLGAGAAQKATNQAPRPPSSVPMGMTLAGLIAAGLLGRSSKRLRGLACVLALACVGMFVSACGGGGGGSSSSTASNPPTGSYTVTVTGTDSVTSNITGTTTFNFTIN